MTNQFRNYKHDTYIIKPVPSSRYHEAVSRYICGYAATGCSEMQIDARSQAMALLRTQFETALRLLEQSLHQFLGFAKCSLDAGWVMVLSRFVALAKARKRHTMMLQRAFLDKI